MMSRTHGTIISIVLLQQTRFLVQQFCCLQPALMLTFSLDILCKLCFIILTYGLRPKFRTLCSWPPLTVQIQGVSSCVFFLSHTFTVTYVVLEQHIWVSPICPSCQKTQSQQQPQDKKLTLEQQLNHIVVHMEVF